MAGYSLSDAVTADLTTLKRLVRQPGQHRFEPTQAPRAPVTAWWRRRRRPGRPCRCPDRNCVLRGRARRGAHRIAGRAELQRLVRIEMSDGDRRRVVVDQIQEPVVRRAEQHHRGDVVGDGRGHRPGAVRQRQSCGDRVKGRVRRHRCALGVTAEHNFGLRACRGDLLDLVTGVDHTVCSGRKVERGRVIHAVDGHRIVAEPGVECVDECLTGAADTGCLECSAGKDHFGSRAGRIDGCCRHSGRLRAHDGRGGQGRRGEPASPASGGVVGCGGDCHRRAFRESSSGCLKRLL